jgi:hypothetical protein
LVPAHAQVDIDIVKADQEVEKALLNGGRNVLQQVGLDLLARRQLAADGHEELERLGVDIADVDAALMGEENVVSLAGRVDADIEPVRIRPANLGILAGSTHSLRAS